MTPKEKAQDFVSKFLAADVNDDVHVIIRREQAKRCSIITVDEIIDASDSHVKSSKSPQQSDYINYWRGVKKEIKKL